MNPKEPTNCHCSCGATKFDVTGSPLFRVICHCTICQRFNEAPFADVTVFRAKNVNAPPAKMVDYETYRRPPNLQRGKCVNCSGAAIELFSAPLLPKLIIIPSENFTSGELLPEPSGHIFYERRESDVQDGLPKYCGYWRSQRAFGRFLIRSLLRS